MGEAAKRVQGTEGAEDAGASDSRQTKNCAPPPENHSQPKVAGGLFVASK